MKIQTLADADAVAVEGLSPGARIAIAGCVAVERLITVGHVGGAGGVAIERLITSSCVKEAGGVANKHTSAVGHVVAAGCVVSERLQTNGRVRAAGCVAKERRITSGRVADAGSEAEEREITLSGVGIGISSVGGWDNPECFRRWAKRREANHQQYCCKCLCRVPILHNLTFFHLFWPSVISHRERIISSHSPIYFRKFWTALQKSLDFLTADSRRWRVRIKERWSPVRRVSFSHVRRSP